MLGVRKMLAHVSRELGRDSRKVTHYKFVHEGYEIEFMVTEADSPVFTSWLKDVRFAVAIDGRIVTSGIVGTAGKREQI